MIGFVKGTGQSATPGLLFLAALLVVSFLMTFFIRVHEQPAADTPSNVVNQTH
ncbi:hypothetical protein [Burkholderia sp. Bp9142]|nr:hypothetical protein [Burkholderia sp. Bp9142]